MSRSVTEDRGYSSGVRHHLAKLTEEKVRDIRRRAAAGETPAALAREFDVTDSTLSRVVLRKTWKHIPEEEGEKAMSTTIPIGTGGDDNVNKGPGKKDLVRVYRDRNGEIRWKRQRPNGRIISDSGEGYKERRDALDGLHMANRDPENFRLVDHTDMEEDYDND